MLLKNIAIHLAIWINEHYDWELWLADAIVPFPTNTLLPFIIDSIIHFAGFGDMLRSSLITAIYYNDFNFPLVIRSRGIQRHQQLANVAFTAKGRSNDWKIDSHFAHQCPHSTNRMPNSAVHNNQQREHSSFLTLVRCWLNDEEHQTFLSSSCSRLPTMGNDQLQHGRTLSSASIKTPT